MHLLRQQRRNRMRDGVMYVQQIEIVALRDLGHARRQRQQVGRVLEQRIAGDLDFVIVDARNAGIEADRIRVGDEMHLVAAIGQLESELGGDDPAAAVGRITCDPDPHGTAAFSSP